MKTTSGKSLQIQRLKTWQRHAALSGRTRPESSSKAPRLQGSCISELPSLQQDSGYAKPVLLGTLSLRRTLGALQEPSQSSDTPEAASCWTDQEKLLSRQLRGTRGGQSAMLFA